MVVQEKNIVPEQLSMGLIWYLLNRHIPYHSIMSLWPHDILIKHPQ